MAYVLPTDEEEKEGKQAQGAGVGSMAPASVAPMAQTGTAPDATNSGPGTGYVGWDRILSANQGAAQKLATKTGDSLEKGAKASQQQLTDAQARFSAGVTAGAGQPLNDAGSLGASKGPGQNVFGQPITNQRSITAATPQEPGVAAAPQYTPDKTRRTELNRVQNETYTGPKSMDEDSGWGAMLKGAGDATHQISLTGQRDENGVLRNNANLAGLLQQQGSSRPGEAGFDADLTGAAGRSRFNELQGKYGGLVNQMNQANEASKPIAANATQAVADRAARAKKELGDMDAAAAKYKETMASVGGAAKNSMSNSPIKDISDGSKATNGKSESWNDYSKWRPEDTLKIVSEDMNPIDWVLNATGNKTMTQGVTPKVEKGVNSVLGSSIDSHRIDFSQLQGFPHAWAQPVYESMTADEVAAVEQMSKRDQTNWMVERAAKLGLLHK